MVYYGGVEFLKCVREIEVFRRSVLSDKDEVTKSIRTTTKKFSHGNKYVRTMKAPSFGAGMDHHIPGSKVVV
jgi:hypothetical protein